MVTTMVTLLNSQSNAKFPWKLPLMKKLPLMVRFMQWDPDDEFDSLTWKAIHIVIPQPNVSLIAWFSFHQRHGVD